MKTTITAHVLSFTPQTVKRLPSVRPEKEDPNRARITAGGDRLDCCGDTLTETVSLEAAKTLINSVLGLTHPRLSGMGWKCYFLPHLKELKTSQKKKFKFTVPGTMVECAQ